MIPTSAIGLVLFVTLLSPGLAYVLRHEQVVPAQSLSAFRETLRVVFMSVVCLTATGLLFAVLRFFLPRHTPNVRGLIRDPNRLCARASRSAGVVGAWAACIRHAARRPGSRPARRGGAPEG
ncbi:MULTISPECIES: DUF6338 family protein [Micromonospora]|uniref:DUF6338 family protein n=1 Tax=Micromonospora TaxID=1873 RepID=UPI0034DF9F09